MDWISQILVKSATHWNDQNETNEKIPNTIYENEKKKGCLCKCNTPAVESVTDQGVKSISPVILSSKKGYIC